jgi:hypothetical protein
MSPNISLPRAVRFLSCAILLTGMAHAQYRAGIQGTVTDSQGAVVPEASVTLTSQETNLSKQATSSSSGTYTFNGLAPGSYTLTAEKAGFKKQIVGDVRIAAEQMQAVDLHLEVGEVSQSVTVSDVAPIIDTETGQVAGTITSKQVQTLPTFGRDPFQLLQLAPGVFGDNARSAGGSGSSPMPGNAGPGGSSGTSSIFQTENQVQVSANGSRNISNSFQIDGIEVNSLAWGGAAVITPNEESVKEVKVIANNYSAENGRNSGAQVLVVSQNGTNSYHGSLFFKADRPGLNSFQRWNGPASDNPGTPQERGLQRDNDRFNQFGGSIGGPIIRNKLFAFFSYETLRNDSVNSSTAWYETPQFLQLAPAGSIASKLLTFPGEGVSFNAVLTRTCADAGLASPGQCAEVTSNGKFAGLDIGSPLTSALGAADTTFQNPGAPGVGNGLDGIPDIIPVDTTNPTQNVFAQYNGRIDFQATSRDLFAFSTYIVPVRTDSFNGPVRPANLFHHKAMNQAGTALWDHTFSSSVINEARFGVTRWYWNEIDTNPQEPWGLPVDKVDTFGSIGILASNSQANQLNFGAPGPSIFNQTTYNIRDTLTTVRGRHSLKFGADLYREQDNDQAPGNARPNYNFRNLWDFLNDAPYQENGVNFNPITGQPTSVRKDIRSNIYAFFAQDDVKLKPNLTVNLGLRWEYFSPIDEKQGNISNVVFGPGANTLTGLALKLGGDLYQSSKNNWGPQIGFAWSPTKYQSKLVFRGGFGVGYNHPQEAITLDGRFNPPLVVALSLNSPNPQGGVAGSPMVYAVPSDVHQSNDWPVNPNAILTFDPTTHLPLGGAPISLVAVPQNLHTPMTYRYSFQTQYDLGHNWAATLGYQGSSTHHYGRTINLNTVLAPLNPQVNQLTYHVDDANANYNALLAELQHRFSRSFEFDTQYSWSKAIDDGSFDYYNDPYPFAASFARGPSDYDATHNFKFWGVWTPTIFRGDHSWLEKIAGGWELSGIWNWHSGYPWSPLYTNTSCNVIYIGSGYCNLRPGAYLGGAGSDYSNSTFMSSTGNFPNGALSYFTVPTFQQGPAFPATGPVPPPPGVGRNSFRGPGYFDIDLTLGKSFGLPKMRVLGESAKLNIRANFYNIFNKLNLNPSSISNSISFDGTTSNPNFGQAQGALGGRIIELQARFSF